MADGKVERSITVTVTLSPEEVSTLRKSLGESRWIGQPHEDLLMFFQRIEDDCQ